MNIFDFMIIKQNCQEPFSLLPEMSMQFFFQDPNVRIIKDLRAEIARLKALLGGSLVCNV